jgi:hypothetical protein
MRLILTAFCVGLLSYAAAADESAIVGSDGNGRIELFDARASFSARGLLHIPSDTRPKRAIRRLAKYHQYSQSALQHRGTARHGGPDHRGLVKFGND